MLIPNLTRFFVLKRSRSNVHVFYTCYFFKVRFSESYNVLVIGVGFSFATDSIVGSRDGWIIDLSKYPKASLARTAV